MHEIERIYCEYTVSSAEAYKKIVNTPTDVTRRKNISGYHWGQMAIA